MDISLSGKVVAIFWYTKEAVSVYNVRVPTDAPMDFCSAKQISSSGLT